eukprot:TRINITY_DN13791_c0_g1_i1.p1 TRINITY_DN13791_c0_g1~~TRINITY_DN13791_c0_g1_i1.p1  ORF type:complete len:425 (+),score=96.28 TRINITY_DN13791_c0_g1_i1:94-1368(+)
MAQAYLDPAEDAEMDEDPFGEDPATDERRYQLRKAAMHIANLFSDDYLWKHDPWRARVRGGVPVAELARSGFAELDCFGPEGSDPATAELLLEALRAHPRSSRLAENLPDLTVTGAPGAEVIRRAEQLDESVHPDLCTVFATPVPYDASNRDVLTFFRQWGEVTRVIRREWTDVGDMKRRKPGVFVVCDTPADAQQIIAAKPQYVSAGDAGGHFVPQLRVAMKRAAEEIWADSRVAAERDHAAQSKGLALRSARTMREQHNPYVARLPPAPAAPAAPAPGAAAAAAAAAPAPAAAPGLGPQTAAYLKPGQVLCIEGLAADAQWRDVRHFVQKGLQLNQGRQKNRIAYTHFEAAERRAFVCLKEPVAAAACERQSAAPVQLKGAVPRLTVAGDSQLAYLNAACQGGAAPPAATGGEPEAKRARST